MFLHLPAYFDRIGYAGPIEPTLDVLSALTFAHSTTIPFENLDILLGRPISLASGDIVEKLVHRRRGGYCFEQNGLFLQVLLAIGFDVRPLSARVRYQRPRDYTPPRTHLFLRVELDGSSWLTDVGVGGLSLTAPIRLQEDIPQETPHDTRRIVREGGVLVHQVRFGEEWVDVYEFTLEEMPPIDRELANWFTSTHPESPFKQRLTVARALPDGRRVTLLNRDLTHRARNGSSRTQVVASPAGLLEVLAREFGLHFAPETYFSCPNLIWEEGRSSPAAGPR